MRSRLLVHAVAMGLVSATISSSTQAQLGTLPDSGARVRVRQKGSSSWMVGTLIRSARDTLLVQPNRSGCCGVDALALSSIRELDVRREPGPSAGLTIAGMTVGLLGGVVAGLGVTEIGCAVHDGGGLCALAALPAMSVLGVAGMFAGGVLASRDRWDRVYPPRGASIFVFPIEHGGIGVGLTLAVGGGA